MWLGYVYLCMQLVNAGIYTSEHRFHKNIMCWYCCGFRHASSSKLKQHEGIVQDGFQFASEWPLQDVYKELEWSTPMLLRLPELVMDVNTQIGALWNGFFQWYETVIRSLWIGLFVWVCKVIIITYFQVLQLLVVYRNWSFVVSQCTAQFMGNQRNQGLNHISNQGSVTWFGLYTKCSYCCYLQKIINLRRMQENTGRKSRWAKFQEYGRWGYVRHPRGRVHMKNGFSTLYNVSII